MLTEHEATKMNPFMSDELGDGPAYQMVDSGLAIYHLSDKVKELGREIKTNGENDRSYSWLMETMKALDLVLDDVRECQNQIYDAMEDEQKYSRGHLLQELMTKRAE